MTEFNGDRLAQALRGRRVSVRSLALVLAVSDDAVLDYVATRELPDAKTVERMALFLGLRPSFFAQKPKPPSLCGPVFERSRAEATEEIRVSVRQRQAWFAELVLKLQHYVQLPAVNVPDFRVGSHWAELADSDFESMSQATRRFWGLGDNPISNVHLLMENNGVVTSALEFNCEALGGFCYRDGDGRPFMALSCDVPTAARSRMDAAHELGHLILHRNVSAVELSDDRVHALVERQAARFARSFLAPRDTFGKEVVRPRMVVFQRLKKHWNIPIVDMVRRMVDLGTLDGERAGALMADYVKLGWVGNEPEEQEREQPLVIRRAMEVLERERVMSRARLAADLPMLPGEIEQICALPAGFFSGAGFREVRRDEPGDAVGDFRAYC